MPTFLRLLLALTLALALSACAEEPAAPARQDAAPTSSATGGETTATSAPAPASATAESPAQPAATAKWTILVFIDADNDLEAPIIGDLNEMELVGSTDQVQIVAQMDRGQNPQRDDTSNGDWQTAKRFLVQKDGDQEIIGSPELEDLGEINMGDPQTLIDFVVWGVRQYPAEHYALMFEDHGAAWQGILGDESHNHDTLTMPELYQALQGATAQSGIGKFDLIGFDACLMASVDVLETLAPYANTFVGSAELEPGTGWSWNVWLEPLVQDPTLDSHAIATNIVASYEQYYAPGDDQTPTLSAFDLTKVEPISVGFRELSDALLAGMGDFYIPIAEARIYAERYHKTSDPDQLSMIDLGHFAQLLSQIEGSGDLAAKAQALVEAITQARVAEWHGATAENSTGISMFFPKIPQAYPEVYNSASPIPIQTTWPRLFQAFYEAGGQLPPAEITGMEASGASRSAPASVRSPSTVGGQISGKIAYVYYLVGLPTPDGKGLELIDSDYIYPPGSSPKDDYPTWPAGSLSLNFSWNATRWALTNGTDTVPAVLDPVEYGSTLYQVDGIYHDKVSGEEFPAGILFKQEKGDITFVTLIGLFGDPAQNASPAEFEPQAGDTFTPLLTTMTDSDDEDDVSTSNGEPITFGEKPLTAIRIPVADGDYQVGLMVEDVSGSVSSQELEVTVDNPAAEEIRPEDIQAQIGPGSQPGTLAYQDESLNIAFEYPESWEALSSGEGEVFVYDLAETSSAFVSVEVTAEDDPDQANRLLMDEIMELLAGEKGFKAQPEQALDLPQGPAIQTDYVFTDADGEEISGFVVVVTSAETGLSYIVTAEALTSELEQQDAIFTAILGSLKIEE